MKKWRLITLLFLLLGLAAGCLGKTEEPVSWTVVEVNGKAVQLKEGTRAWHKVTIKNTGGTKAERVELSFRMPGLVEYGDGVAAVYPGQKFTVSNPSRVYKKADFIRYLYNYEGDGTVIIKWQENGIKKSKRIPYIGKYHPKEPTVDKPSQHTGEKTMGLQLSPSTKYLVQSAGSEILLYKTATNEAPTSIWTNTDSNYWGSSNVNWSSNGQMFIFTSTSYPGDNWKNYQSTVWLVDLQNPPAQKILNRKGIQTGQWSPDGRYILFQYEDELRNAKRIHGEASALLLYDTKTAKSRLLVSGKDKQHIVNPLWSPDSQRLVYNAMMKDNRFVLAVYNLQQGKIEQMETTEKPYFPQAWSRDGKKVYYDIGSYGCVDMGMHQLGIYDLDTRQDHPLTTDVMNGPNNSFVSLSPDEKTLLFTRNNNMGSKPELWQMNIESGTSQRVLRRLPIYDVFWTDDSSSYIYYLSNDRNFNGMGSIWDVNIDQPQPRELLKGAIRLEQLYNGKLYFIEASPAGLVYNDSLKSLDLSSGQLKTILCLPESTSASDKSNATQDFGLIMKYGVRARNELNTLEGTFTKDLILAGNSTTRLKLSNSELEEIYKEMQAINIVAYPEFFLEESQQCVTPYITYDLTIHYKGTIKQIHWEDRSLSKSQQAIQLRDLVNKIVRMVEKKPEYKEMPAIEGGY